MPEADVLQRQRVLQQRYQSMGLEARLLPDARSVVVTLPVGPEPFETPAGPRSLQALRFYTVGSDRIKCMAPRALFFLPLLRVGDCHKAEQIEGRIRQAWTRTIHRLERARTWLEQLGVEPSSPQGTPQWSLGLGLDDPRARAAVVEPGRVILPSRGPLSGLSLDGVEQRIFAPDPGCRSGVDLDLAITARLEALGRERRSRRAVRTALSRLPATPRARRRAPILLVGPRLAADSGLQESLRVRGLDVRAVNSLADTLEAFKERTYYAVLAEIRLDRGDGIELIPAVRMLPGIQELPIALLDDRAREGRRDAARQAGATAYLAGAPRVERLAPALEHLVKARKRRRFKRYERPLSVSWPDGLSPGVTSSIGRGGAFVRSAAVLADGPYAFHIPDVSITMEVECEVMYRQGGEGWGARGAGLCFRRFAAGHEAALIGYLTKLEELGARRVD